MAASKGGGEGHPRRSDGLQDGGNSAVSRDFWASKTQMSRNRERGIAVPFFPEQQRIDKFRFEPDLWKETTSEYDTALVGFVFGSKPHLGKVRGFARNKWGDEKVVKVRQMTDGFFMLLFTSKEKKLEALHGGPWTFENKPFIVREWSEKEDYKIRSIKSVPVWIRLPEIKAHLTNINMLGMLCSTLGKPICTDGVTAERSSLSFARVCVEIFADSELIHEIAYEDPDGNSYVQNVVYEWRPPRCTNCHTFGHLCGKCPEQKLEDMIAKHAEKEKLKRQAEEKRILEDDIEEHEDDNLENQLAPQIEEVVSVDESKTEKGESSNTTEASRVPETIPSQVPETNTSNVKEISDGITLGEALSRCSLKKARQKERRRLKMLKMNLEENVECNAVCLEEMEGKTKSEMYLKGKDCEAGGKEVSKKKKDKYGKDKKEVTVGKKGNGSKTISL